MELCEITVNGQGLCEVLKGLAIIMGVTAVLAIIGEIAKNL